ncbi:hypothetical protein D3C84_1156370 [compost metagenome]
MSAVRFPEPADQPVALLGQLFSRLLRIGFDDEQRLEFVEMGDFKVAEDDFAELAFEILIEQIEEPVARIEQDKPNMGSAFNRKVRHRRS